MAFVNEEDAAGFIKSISPFCPVQKMNPPKQVAELVGKKVEPVLENTQAERNATLEAPRMETQHIENVIPDMSKSLAELAMLPKEELEKLVVDVVHDPGFLDLVSLSYLVFISTHSVTDGKVRRTVWYPRLT